MVKSSCSASRRVLLGVALAGSAVAAGGLSAGRVPYPAENPPTPEKVALGRALFYDPLLSEDGKVACATCHKPELAFTDGGKVSVGAFGRTGKRSAPSLVNVAFRTRLFWHGGSPSLELQALGPLSDHNEHALRPEETVAKLRESRRYAPWFVRVFGRAPDLTGLTQAVASFERTIISDHSPFDRYSAGDGEALTPAQVRGMDLFYDRAECFHCHNGSNFSDNLPHNNGSELFNEDVGVAGLTGDDADVGKFITPTLRNIAVTGPYMHAGGMASLKEVVQQYNGGGQANPNTDPLVRPLGLTDGEVDDLVAFLHALTDPTVATNPAFGPPEVK